MVISALRIIRVLRQLSLGLAALGFVVVGRRTLGCTPRGLAVLGRFASRLAPCAGMTAAVITATRARHSVPAYRDELRGVRPWREAFRCGELSGYLEALPVLDRRSYVDRHRVERRCREGRIPLTDIEVDESSGSSGRPYQWVRSRSELDEVERMMGVQAEYLLRSREHRRVVVLNCFSMGAWATGASVTGALRRIGVIKSCGPDAEKALAAVELIGPGACYVVCGYPPFLASFLAAAEAAGIDLAGYEMWGFVGGEGMTEMFRGRLERRFRRVISAYGASDLDIGVAGETSLAIALRQAAATNPDLAQALFGTTARLPMVFQYDPSMYYVEAAGDELVITVARALLSPRVRYAVHDVGGTISYAEALAIARAHGVEPPVAGSPRSPFLFVAGRADSTVSHMGANLYPEDVDAALGAVQEQHPHFGLGSFCIELLEAGDGSTVPLIHVEADRADADDIRTGIADWLVRHNRDWAAAAGEDPSAPYFEIRIAAPGTGVFSANATRIKRRYVLEAA